jgi:hypothetical protein
MKTSHCQLFISSVFSVWTREFGSFLLAMALFPRADLLRASFCILFIVAGVRGEQDVEIKDEPVVKESPVVEANLYQLPVLDKKDAFLFEPFVGADFSAGSVK